MENAGLGNTVHKLGESKVAVIAREENNFRRSIHEALEIQCQLLKVNLDHKFDLDLNIQPHTRVHVLAYDLVHPSSRNKYIYTTFT